MSQFVHVIKDFEIAVLNHSLHMMTNGYINIIVLLMKYVFHSMTVSKCLVSNEKEKEKPEEH